MIYRDLLNLLNALTEAQLDMEVLCLEPTYSYIYEGSLQEAAKVKSLELSPNETLYLELEVPE